MPWPAPTIGSGPSRPPPPWWAAGKSARPLQLLSLEVRSDGPRLRTHTPRPRRGTCTPRCTPRQHPHRRRHWPDPAARARRSCRRRRGRSAQGSTDRLARRCWLLEHSPQTRELWSDAARVLALYRANTAATVRGIERWARDEQIPPQTVRTLLLHLQAAGTAELGEVPD
jgi:hypothetical protein